MGRENLNTVAFQCNRKQKHQHYGVQNNYIDSNAKIKGGQNYGFYSSCLSMIFPATPKSRLLHIVLFVFHNQNLATEI